MSKTTATMIRSDIEENGFNAMTRTWIADLAARRRVNFAACIAYAEFYAPLAARDALVTEEQAAELRRLADEISGEERTIRNNA